MDDLYTDALAKMAGYFDSLANLVEKPSRVWLGDTYAYRYRNKSIQSAILQKLSRIVTGLQAMYLLNRVGLLQEQGTMQRVLDELDEDILFLTLAIIKDDHTELHDRYLEAFYKEEYDPGASALESSQNRPMIPRKKIRAYINKFGDNQSKGIEVSRTISKMYSGFVHGASPHIMEMYYGSPPKFHLRGACDSPYYQDHVDELLSYFYRGIMTFAFSAKSFGNDDLFEEIYSYTKDFAVKSGNPQQLSQFV